MDERTPAGGSRITAMICRLRSCAIGALVVVALLGSPCLGENSVTRLTNDGRSTTRVGIGWSPDGSHILFYKSFKEGTQLWTMRADGSESKAISRIGQHIDTGWSPDSRKIVYVHAEKKGYDAQSSLYVYDCSTQQNRELESARWGRYEGLTGWGVPEWANDSKHFVILVDKDPEVRMMADSVLFDAKTGHSLALTPNNHSTGIMYPGFWSPDGSKLLMWSKPAPDTPSQVWLCDRDGSGLHPITPTWGIRTDPVWSPTGDWIAFCTYHNRPKDEADKLMSDLWLVRPDGKDVHCLISGSSPSTEKRISFVDPQWVDEGRYILCRTNRWDTKGWFFEGLAIVEVTTGKMTMILENDPNTDKEIDGMWAMVSVSPDRKKLALTAMQWTVTGRNSDNPHWQDAQSILYYYDFETKRLVELIRTHPQQDGVTLFRYGWNDKPFFSPDNKSLLFTKSKVISWEDWKFEPDIYVYHMDLTSIATAGGAVEQASTTTAAVTASAAQPKLENKTAPGPAVLISPKYRRASEIAVALPQAYSNVYKVDQGLNALVVSAPDEATLTALKRDVELLDRLVPQIMVDVLVTELTRDASKELGLDWEFAKGRIGFNLPLSDIATAGDVIFKGVGKLDKKFFVTLSALEEEGKATVKANPRVLAACGTEATINIRRTDNFLYESGTDISGRPVRTRSDISADTILKIAPQLMDSGRIAMKIDATVDNFIFGAKNDLPDTTRRQATTDVVVGNGDTIIIGGLTLEESAKKVQKTPVLGDLPVVGGLFQNTSRSSKQTTLVIFLSPHVVKEGETSLGSDGGWGVDAKADLDGGRDRKPIQSN